MKTSIFAILLLILIGAGGYWLQSTGRLQSYWPAAAAMLGQPAQTGNATAAEGSTQPTRGNRGPTPVEVADAMQVRLSDDITAIGSLLSDASVDIAPETSGRVVDINFADGDRVEQGAILFRFDGELISATVADAESKLALAESNFRRNEALLKSKNIAQSAYDQSATELSLARSALDLARVLKNKLEIRAPFSGTLGFRQVSTGAYVTAGTPLVHLEKIDRLKVSFSVPELQFSRLSTGQNVAVTADAVAGETFTATIAAIDPLVEVSGRALRVQALLDNAALKLRPGMLIRVTVQGPSREAVTVPEAAIVPRGNDSIVFLAEEDKATETKVRTGKRADGTVEIIEGIKPGSKVVTAGNTRLSNGSAIQIVKPQAAN